MLASALKRIEGPHKAEQRSKCPPAFRDQSCRVPLSMRPLHRMVVNAEAYLEENLCTISSLVFILIKCS